MAIGAAAVTAVGGITKSIVGASQARKARKAINSYQRQELTNAYDGVSVSTLGANLQQEELARATATGVDALRSGGTRALGMGLGRLQQGNTTASREIGAGLDLQQKEIDKLKAQDETWIRDMQETREQEDLAGLGQQLSAGQQTQYSGLDDIFGAAGGFMGAMGQGAGGGSGGRAGLSSVGSIQPKGLTSLTTANPFSSLKF